MPSQYLYAALASALLHAAWNAAIKASSAPREAMSAQMVASGLMALLLLPWVGLPRGAAWGFVALSVVLNMVAVRALLRAYERGGFGTVYPIVRACSVLGTALASSWVLGESVAPLAWGGILLIVGALALLAFDGRAAGGVPGGAGAHGSFPLGALGWTLLSGLSTAAYVLADALGSRFGQPAGNALSYGLAVSICNALAMSWLMRGVGTPGLLLKRHLRLAVPAACASMASYLMILWVYRHASVAPAAALRDTSALWAIVIATLFLKEALPLRRLLALALALAGVPLLRLG